MATDTDPQDLQAPPASAEGSASSPPRSRSLWRVSLGGIMIFAAGMMVGFAPMRAWLFFREEPEFVEIDLRLFEAAASEADAVRQAFSEPPSSDAAPALDPEQILASRSPSIQWISKPIVTTMVNREARLVARSDAGSSARPPANSQPDVIEASFTPSVRPSGMLELEYRIKQTAPRVDESGTPVGSDEAVTESSALVAEGVWHLIEVRSPSRSDVENGRSRWLLLRAKPVESIQ